MKRIAFWFVALCLGAAIQFWIVSSGVTLEPAFIRIAGDYVKTAWLARAAEWLHHFSILMMVGLPLTLLLHSIAETGSDHAGQDVHGYTELRLRSGTRFLIVLLVGFLLFVFAMAFGETDSLIFQLFSLAGGIFFLWAGVWLLRLRVRFDRSVLIAPDYLGRTHRHAWNDLVKYSYNQEAMEYHLEFSTGKRARASRFLAGIDMLLDQADVILRSYR